MWRVQRSHWANSHVKLTSTIITLAFVTLVCGCSQLFESSDESSSRLEFAPEFKLPDKSGIEHTLETERGKVLFLSFSAPWCFLCQAETQRLEFLHNYIGSDRVAVVVIATFDSAAKLSEFANRAGPFPILIDQNGKVAREYNVRSLPATFIIGPDGRYLPLSAEGAYRFDGMIDWGAAEQVAAVERLVSSLLPR